MIASNRQFQAGKAGSARRRLLLLSHCFAHGLFSRPSYEHVVESEATTSRIGNALTRRGGYEGVPLGVLRQMASLHVSLPAKATKNHSLASSGFHREVISILRMLKLKHAVEETTPPFVLDLVLHDGHDVAKRIRHK